MNLKEIMLLGVGSERKDKEQLEAALKILNRSVEEYLHLTEKDRALTLEINNIIKKSNS